MGHIESVIGYACPNQTIWSKWTYFLAKRYKNLTMIYPYVPSEIALKLIISNRNLYLTLYITWVGPLKCTIIKQWQKKEELMFVILRVLFCSQYYRWRGSISHFSTVVETYTILNQDFSNQNKKNVWTIYLCMKIAK